MVDHLNGSRGENPTLNTDDHIVSERVRELTWALLDEQINDDEFDLLENLLLSDAKARDSYLGCVQLHAGLGAYFAESPTGVATKTAANPQVLGFLSAESALGFQSSSEEATP